MIRTASIHWRGRGFRYWFDSNRVGTGSAHPGSWHASTQKDDFLSHTATKSQKQGFGIRVGVSGEFQSAFFFSLFSFLSGGAFPTFSCLEVS